MQGVAGVARGKTQLMPRWSAAVDDYVVAVEIDRAGHCCLVGTGAGQVSCIDLGTGLEKFRSQAHASGLLGLSMSPDASGFVTCGTDDVARLWSPRGEPLRELAGGGKEWVEHVVWSPCGRRIATSAGRTVRVWTPEGALVLESAAPESSVSGLTWRSDGTGLAASCYGGVHVWPFIAGARQRHLDWKGSLISIAWSPDAKVIACGSQDRSVHFWRIASGEDAQMSGYPLKPRALAWDHESKLLATAGAAAITIWDFRGKGPEGTRPLELEGHQTACTRLAFSPRQCVLASGSQDGSVLLWAPRRGARPTRHDFLRDEVTALAWHPDQLGLLGADAAGTVTFWEMG